MTITTNTRRTFLQGVAGAALAAPWVSGAHAAGKLSCGFWDHWVPGSNKTMTKLCQEWAAREKVDISVDYITSQGDKILLTIASESQARAGHDILSIPNWFAPGQADNLEPVDELVAPLITKHGEVSPDIAYLGKQNGHWVAMPSAWGNAQFPCNGRIDLLKEHAGLDVLKMYPAGAPPDAALADAWTWDAFLTAAEKCAKAGFPFGMPMGSSSDAVNWVGGVFASYGAELVDSKGNITVNSDPVKQVLEYFQKLVPHLPDSVWAWDNAGNNKWLLSGKGALISNPTSAWVVAKRDTPKIGEQMWHFPMPKGPKGRFQAGNCYFWGIWRFSPNKAAAKSLLAYLSEPASIEQLVNASEGYDIPAFKTLHDYPVWAEQGPPKGTLYRAVPREDVVVSITGAPAPTAIATQMFAQGTMTKLIAKLTQEKRSMKQSLDWAQSEIEGFMRT